jgi:molybdopterin-guanine dinucleotide biosynthesis protein
MRIYIVGSVASGKTTLAKKLSNKLGMEECLYTPSIHMLKFMFKALNNYETGKDYLQSRLNEFTNKVVILSSSKEIKRFIESVLQSEYGISKDKKSN